jgi:hypothetical protein
MFEYKFSEQQVAILLNALNSVTVHGKESMHAVLTMMQLLEAPIRAAKQPKPEILEEKILEKKEKAK